MFWIFLYNLEQLKLETSNFADIPYEALYMG